MISGDLEARVPQENAKEDQIARIVAASLDVFSECSFQDATTDEIARRARVSKRDIYAHFPNKHSLLLAAMMRVLKAEEDNLVETIARVQTVPSLRKRLEAIALTLIAEVLSVKMSVITRHVTSESIGYPLIGSVYFERGPARRSKLISEFLSSTVLDWNAPTVDAIRAAEQYLALIAYQPHLTTLTGMQDTWDVAAAQSHVERAVECFLRAYPRLA